MIVNFDRSFSKSLDKLTNKLIREKIQNTIIKLEQAKNLDDLTGVKAMKGHQGFYRLRIGDYRLGFELTAPGELLLILVAHRKDIYKRFP